MNNGRRSKHGLNRRMRRNRQKLEANRRFAVYHIREDDEDFLFTNDYYQTRCRRLIDTGCMIGASCLPDRNPLPAPSRRAGPCVWKSSRRRLRISAPNRYTYSCWSSIWMKDGSAYAAGIMPGRPMGCRTSRSPPTRRTVRLTAAKTAAGKSSMPTSAVGSWTEKGSGRTAVQ